MLYVAGTFGFMTLLFVIYMVACFAAAIKGYRDGMRVNSRVSGFIIMLCTGCLIVMGCLAIKRIME